MNRPAERTGHGSHQRRLAQRLSAWLGSHVRALFYSVGQLVRTPLISMLAIAVIGITLALPTGLFVLLGNVAKLSIGWETGGQISLYLRDEIDEPAARALMEALHERGDIARVELITRDDALREYQQLSGFGEALTALQGNPLPHTLLVNPLERGAGPDQLERLRGDLAAHAAVETAQLDLDWVRRLHALTGLARNAVGVLAALLALAVVLVIGNTIRVGVFNRRDEIEISRLFGATKSFVRRPFLYTGALFGAAGGLLAAVLVNLCFWVLAEPVGELARLYYRDFTIGGLAGIGVVVLILVGALLGLGGSWLAVGRYVNDDHLYLV